MTRAPLLGISLLSEVEGDEITATSVCGFKSIVQEQGIPIRPLTILAGAKEREAMLDDVHLIEAALATDYIIASRDETVRGLFCEASESIGLIKPVVWVNPTTEEERCLDWLKNGAPQEKKRQLGFKLE